MEYTTPEPIGNLVNKRTSHTSTKYVFSSLLQIITLLLQNSLTQECSLLVLYNRNQLGSNLNVKIRGFLSLALAKVVPLGQ